MIDGDHRVTPTGEQVRSELTLPVHMSLIDIAGQQNPGGPEAVREAAEREWAQPVAAPGRNRLERKPAAAPVEPEEDDDNGYQDVGPGAWAPAEHEPVVPRAGRPAESTGPPAMTSGDPLMRFVEPGPNRPSARRGAPERRRSRRRARRRAGAWSPAGRRRPSGAPARRRRRPSGRRGHGRAGRPPTLGTQRRPELESRAGRRPPGGFARPGADRLGPGARPPGSARCRRARPARRVPRRRRAPGVAGAPAASPAAPAFVGAGAIRAAAEASGLRLPTGSTPTSRRVSRPASTCS